MAGLGSPLAWPVYLLALGAPFSMALVSLGKALVLFTALGWLLRGLFGRASCPRPALAESASVHTALLMLGALALSLGWTQASLPEAAAGIAKYGKLLLLPAVLVLLRTRREAMVAVGCLLAGQAVVVVLSVLLGLRVFVPALASGLSPGTAAVVSSSYLDQSIMTACFAALCWHFRGLLPGRRGLLLGGGFAVVSALNILTQLDGRTGYVGVLVAATLASWWACQRRWRPLALLSPLLLVAAALLLSPRVQERTTDVLQDLSTASAHNLENNSIGLRLHFWRGSLEAIQERPLIGSGAGSWAWFYKSFDQGRYPSFQGLGGNPHNEYLLWGVQLGLTGMALLLGLMAALVRDALRIADPGCRRGMISVTAILAASCMFNSSLHDGFIGDYFCMALALLLALGAQPARSPA